MPVSDFTTTAGGIALDVQDLHKDFGGIKAVNGCHLQIPKGKISGLIGPNGSGKTTTFNLLTGVIPPDSGKVMFKGENIAGLKPHQIFRKGITRTFQITRIYREMTVFENLLSVAYLKIPMHQARARAEELMEFVTLTKLRDEYGGFLSYGQQKLLEFARALMTDPAAGVNRTLLASLLERIHELQKQGKTILIVEHDMNVIMNHCEKIFVMDYGENIAEGKPEEIQNNERVVEAYFGHRKHADAGA